MRVLCINVPNVKYVNGQIFTGPHAGSRWPWTMPGASFHNYAPYPFRLGYAVNYLRAYGIQADLYDGVAARHADLDRTKDAIRAYNPTIAFFEVATPVYKLTNEIAAWTKATLGCKVVYGGYHTRAYAQQCKAEPHVDHVVSGNEFELPLLDLITRYPLGDPIYAGRHLEQIDTLPDGSNFSAFCDYLGLGAYYDPSQATPRTQVQLNTSRSCPWACTFCNVSRTFENASYRARAAEYVVDEMRQVKSKLGNSLGSWFFDDDVWGLGAERLKGMCKGLKELGLPWSFMSRADAIDLPNYDLIVDSGCVGMRFGIESFSQQALDNVKKNLSAKTLYDNLRHLVTRYRGIEFHFTTLLSVPGTTPQTRQRDEQILSELIQLGRQHGNVVHYQSSEVVPFPGTELYQELVALGHGERLADFNLYDGAPDHNQSLIKTIGLLGQNYRPKHSKFSEPVGKPS